MWEWEECNSFDVASGSIQILPSHHALIKFTWGEHWIIYTHVQFIIQMWYNYTHTLVHDHNVSCSYSPLLCPHTVIYPFPIHPLTQQSLSPPLSIHLLPSPHTQTRIPPSPVTNEPFLYSHTALFCPHSHWSMGVWFMLLPSEQTIPMTPYPFINIILQVQYSTSM